MALATLANLKTYLGITVSTEDSRLQMMLDAAMAGIIQACIGYQFEQATFTEYYQPDGTILILKRRPVQSITSIYEDPSAAWGQASGAFGSDTLLTEGEDYALHKDGSGNNGEISRSGLVERIGRTWARVTKPVMISGTNSGSLLQKVVPALGAVKATYVAGYTTVPADVVLAVYAEVDMMRLMRKKGGGTVQSESLGEYSYSLANVDKASHPFGYFLSPQTATLLAPYLVGGGLFI